jgi:hypothetical protein
MYYDLDDGEDTDNDADNDDVDSDCDRIEIC